MYNTLREITIHSRLKSDFNECRRSSVRDDERERIRIFFG